MSEITIGCFAVYLKFPVVVNPSIFERTKHTVSINISPIWRRTAIVNGDSVVPEVNVGQRLYSCSPVIKTLGCALCTLECARKMIRPLDEEDTLRVNKRGGVKKTTNCYFKPPDVPPPTTKPRMSFSMFLSNIVISLL